MKRKTLGYLFSIAASLGLVHSASAQYNWSGADNNGLWSDPGNWVQGVVPPSSAGDIFVDPVTYTGPVIIGASDVVQNTGTLQGPEWGQTLDVYGTVIDGYALSTVGALNGPTSTLNLYGNGSVTCGDSFFVGEPWWAAGIQNAAVNLYDNSSVTANYLVVSGHLNLYGGTVTALDGFLTGTATTGGWGSPLVTDASRMINLAGGKLVIVGDITSQVNDLISRGILEGNGIVGNVNVDLLSDPGYTVVTAVPEPATFALLTLGGLVLVLRRRQTI